MNQLKGTNNGLSEMGWYIRHVGVAVCIASIVLALCSKAGSPAYIILFWACFSILAGVSIFHIIARRLAANPHVTVSRNGRAVSIREVTRVAIPGTCAVCGESALAILSYRQDYLPLTLPFVAFLRWVDVKVPYCAQHALEFQRRFKMLRIAQGILYALVVLAMTVGLMSPLRVQLGLSPQPGAWSLAMLGVLFLALAGTIFIVRPRWYDVFIRRTRRGVRISCKHAQFIEALVAANGDTGRSRGQSLAGSGDYTFIRTGL